MLVCGDEVVADCLINVAKYDFKNKPRPLILIDTTVSYFCMASSSEHVLRERKILIIFDCIIFFVIKSLSLTSYPIKF